jgi:hypothetical protein
VLTGALYRVLVRLHEEYKSEEMARTGQTEFSVSGKALFRAREHFKRLVFRALDYLPPGEVSFGDYGRAILAADQASHPDESLGRNELVKEFLRRHIIHSPTDLIVQTDFAHPATEDLDLDTLVESDWAAYDFANHNRPLLNIPENIHFRVRPRLKATKTYYLAEGPTQVKECIFKVSWDRDDERNPDGSRLPARRQITVGTTLAIDWETKKVRVLLPSHAAVKMGTESEEQEADRSNMIARLLATNRLRIGSAEDPTAGSAVRVETSNSLMRIRGSGRLLHIVAEED